MRTYEKSAILEIVKCSKDLDYNDKNQVKAALTKGNQNEVLVKTIFGGRFLKRLSAMVDSQEYEHKCVLCERPENGIVCPTCMEQLMPAVVALSDKDLEEVSHKASKSVSEGTSKEKEVSGDVFSDKDKSISELGYSAKNKQEQVVADSEWLMDELVRNMDSSMDRLANQKSVQKINRIMYFLLFMGIFDTIGIILIILMLKGVIV